MSRRALTLLLASVLALGLALVGGVHTVPYVALTPGPAFNTLGEVDRTQVLTISGAKSYPTDGTLDLTTVSVQDKVTLFEAIRGWFSSSEAVVPKEIVFPPSMTAQQNEQQNIQEMADSHDDATEAALTELNEPVSSISITAFSKDSPAMAALKVGDTLTSVDGKTFSDADQLRTLISARAVGAPVRIGYLRGGTPGTATITTFSSGQTPPRALIGITPRENFAITVNIQLKDVGGPSAGLMFALGIVDKLGPDSLTGGKAIAGTGTIDAAGNVGAIGGIPQKMRGAKAKGATIFLAPASNCDEAKKNKPSGITLVKVSTLHGALEALSTLRSGGTPPSC